MKCRMLTIGMLVALGLAGQALAADNNENSIGRLRALMEQKDLVYFVTPAPQQPGDFVGIQYLKGMAFIAIYSTVGQENLAYVNDTLQKKDYRKLYKDLSMLKGNSYTVVFDFNLDNLRINGGSGDFIQQNENVRYLNKGYSENGFKSSNEYEGFVKLNQDKYSNWLGILESRLK